MIALMTAAGVSLLFTLFMTPVFIRIFRKVGWGQFIREDGPQSHHAKHGTPTMGGIVVIVGSVLAYFLGHLIGQQPITASGLLVLFMMVGLGLVGFIDDFIKTHKHRSLGLGGVAKIVGQIVVAVAFAVIALQLPNSAGELPASTNISFIRDFNIDFLVWGAVGVALFLLWISLITVATSNAVNVTDGLDGLATGSLIMGIGAYIIIGFWQFNQSCLAQLDPAVADRCYDTRDPLDLAIVAAAIVGGLIGFLWWNTSPAQIFMGDTGSLGLGGAMAALAILSRTELLIILLGGIFVISAGSVIVQRIYFKLTHGKRIFRMSPLHHHFELKGWAEVTVVVRFWIIGGLCVATGVGLFYLEWLAG